MESNPTSKKFFNNVVVFRLQRALLKGSIKKMENILCQQFGAKLSTHEDEVNKCKEIVQLCLDLEINLNTKDKYSTLLHFVAKKLDVETFKSVLNRSTDFNINALYKRSALLHIVTKEGKENFVKALIDFGADVNVKDVRQETSLFYAISENYPQLVQLLLNYGAEIRYENFLLGVRRIAIWKLPKKIIEILLEAGYDVTVKKNGMLPIDRIFDRYFAISIFNSDGYFYWTNIKLLCAYGCDVNLNNKTGTDLLGFLSLLGLLDDVLFAVKYGADLFAEETDTALHGAVFGSNLELVDYLLRQGLDINVKSKLGDTPLQRLSKLIHSNYLLECESKFRKKITKKIDMIEFLVDNGADLNALDDQLLSPVETIIYLNFLEVFECFFELNVFVHFEQVIVSFSQTTAFSDNESTGNISERNDMFKLMIEVLATKEDDISSYLQQVSDLTVSERIKCFFEKCKIQVNKMKESNICRDRNISFFDFMLKDLMEVVMFSRNEEIMLVLESGEYKNEFPCYEFLLGKRIERVKLIRNYVNGFSFFLGNFYKKQVPLIVLDKILSFLRVGDVRNFARALKISNDFPDGKYCIE